MENKRADTRPTPENTTPDHSTPDISTAPPLNVYRFDYLATYHQAVIVEAHTEAEARALLAMSPPGGLAGVAIEGLSHRPLWQSSALIGAPVEFVGGLQFVEDWY